MQALRVMDDTALEALAARVPAGPRAVIRDVRAIVRRAGNPLRPLPDFLIIGAQKSGTTSLYDHLVQHPQIRPAIGKGIHYFFEHFERGEGWYRSRFPMIPTSRRDGSRRLLTGEASPDYLDLPHVPERAVATVPDALLIAVLRHPVERAFSHYQHNRRKGREPAATFAEALDLEAGRLAAATEPGTWALQHQGYMRRGRYAAHLDTWTERFDRSQLLLLRAEDLFTCPAAVVARTITFLGLEPTAPVDYPIRNAGGHTCTILPDDARRIALDLADDIAALDARYGIRWSDGLP